MRAAALVLVVLGGCGRLAFDERGPDGGPGDRDGAAGDAGATDDAGAPGSGANLAFATSTVHAPGALGGLAGADAICGARAAAIGLPGAYVAWLSTAAVAAPTRLAGARGWVRPDGRPVADLPAQLTTALWYPLDLDETGAPIRTTSPDGVLVTTTTRGDGSYDGADCQGFTVADGSFAARGRADFGTRNWTQNTALERCSTASRLYCFGVDRVTPVQPTPGAVRRAFVTAMPAFAPGGGRASADAACQAEADAAALGGSYRALLADVGVSAAASLPLAGAPWARVDGVLLAETPAGFAAGAFLAPLEVTAAGAHLTVSSVITGAATITTPGSLLSTCEGWTRTGGGAMVTVGQALSVELFSDVQLTCQTPGRVYCVEQ